MGRFLPFLRLVQFKSNELIIDIIKTSGDGGEKQRIGYGNPFQRHIQGIQQGQWW